MIFARRLETGVPSRMFWLVISGGESQLPWSSRLVGPRTPASPESIEIAGVKFFRGARFELPRLSAKVVTS